MASKKIQLYTDRDKTIEASPETSANCVILSDGNDLQKVLDNDLTTPTVVHEETSFKVGVGDVNVSSSVVDGESSKVVIKGKTYQNILPEPSLRNSMTNGKSMQKLNEGYENVNVVDGVAKSAILKGQTLVNTITNVEGQHTWATVDNITFTHIKDSVGFSFINYNCSLKPNTKYFIRFEYDYAGNENLTLQFGFRTNLGAWDSYGTTLTKGVNKATLTTNGTSNNLSVIIMSGQTLESASFGKLMVIEYQEGMENWDIPYFEGMQSVRMPVLTTTGKNLCKYRNGFSSNGLTFTNTDSGVTVDGTASTIVDYYITTRTGLINVETLDILNSLQVGTRVFLSNNLGKSSFISYTLNGETKYADNVTIQNGMQIIGAFIRFREGDICNNLNLTIQLEIGNEVTSYEPHKSNILSTPSDLVLRGIGDVKDELNLITGELTQRIEEKITLDYNMYSMEVRDSSLDNHIIFGIKYFTVNHSEYQNTYNCIVNNLIYMNWNDYLSAQDLNKEFASLSSGGTLVVSLLKSRLVSIDLDGFRQYLSQNPIAIQYKLATPVVKTVDLSSFGNWEKVVLDGSDDEGWGKTESTNSNTKSLWFMPVIKQLKGGAIFCDKLPTTTSGDSIGVRNSKSGGIYIHIDKMETLGVREWVAKNSPLTIWYQTTTSQANSIKEMLSFSNGHIQLSSGADNSLIPSLNYEVPTSNSYHMDLMKTNTRHTMKAKTASGTFTIDGTSYGAGTNGTFTTPSSMTNKLLIMSNNTNEEVMILEGDVVSKTIPYFKGIKSTFEDESKIEVLSTGKNLFDRKLSEYDYLGNYDKNEVIIGDNFIEWNASSTYKGAAYYHFYVKPNTSYILSLERNIMQRNCTTIYDGFVTSNMNSISNMEANKNNISFVTLSNKITIRFSNGTILNETFKIYNVQLEEGGTVTTYEPYKSNSTKIPLLSPLRSLPNGACDELIIDRMKKKATLIQRVGKAMFDGSDNEIWGFMDSPSDTTSYLYQCYVRDAKANSNDASEHLLCKNILVRTANSNWNNKYESGIALNENKNIQLRCTKDESSFRSWLSKNPTTVYYQLETPVVTEVDLEGFPYIYKDGHIFLNSEIAPVVEIAYNVNQTQQIQANNETLQRHELDILDLDNLIVSFVNAEYNLRLLKFDMELSMMALAE